MAHDKDLHQHFGYGFAHDSGLAIVDGKTAMPVFASSLERMSRRKTDGNSPWELYSWADKYSSTPWTPSGFYDTSIFSEENGFYAVEHSNDWSYRWAKPVASFRISSNSRSLIISVLPSHVAGRVCKFRVKTGNNTYFFDNRRHMHVLEAPIKSGQRVEILSDRFVTESDDPRELGIQITGIYVCFTGNHATGTHAVASESGPQIARRIIEKSLVNPKTRSWKHKGKTVLKSLAITTAAFWKGYRSPLTYRRVDRSFLPSPKHFDHHLCHAASAYYQSGLQKAIVLTLDGIGDTYSSRVYLGTNGKLFPKKSYYFEELPTGLNYELVTGMLGMNPTRHAGKVTGLAAHGQFNSKLAKKLNRFFDKVWNPHDKLDVGVFLWSGEAGYKRLQNFRRKALGAFSREDIAWYIQNRTEVEIIRLVEDLQIRYPAYESIALAGGVFANVRLNQKIKELGFNNLFVQPAMSDAGLCMGAALLSHVEEKGKLIPYPLENVFLGPEFSDQEIRTLLEKEAVTYDYISDEEDLCREVGRLISEEKIVAHFNGRMEFGPRALGNRSILYMPKDPTVNTWLNNRLNRTEFMPFAPACLYEDGDRYFLGLDGIRHTAEFMTITCDCTETAKEEIPAAIHIDGTARPQLVHKDHNPRFWRILQEYKKLTGFSACINTSFNMHEEPIVATPEDALRAWRESKLDILVLNRFVIQAEV